MDSSPVPSVKEQKRELNNQGGWPNELGGNGPYEYTECESENGQEMEGDRMTKINATLPMHYFSFLFFFSYNLSPYSQMVTWDLYFLFLKKGSSACGC